MRTKRTCWLCRMIGHRWVTREKTRVGDVNGTAVTVWGCCTRCGTTAPRELRADPPEQEYLVPENTEGPTQAEQKG